jgi:hypothetical protein
MKRRHRAQGFAAPGAQPVTPAQPIAQPQVDRAPKAVGPRLQGGVADPVTIHAGENGLPPPQPAR